MSEETADVFHREGDLTFGDESTEEDTSADSHSENDNQGGETHSSGGESSQDADNIPFHEHPRWKQRETEWNDRFNEQERRHQEDITRVLEAVAGGKKAPETSAPVKMPSWFGGTEEQWEAYRSDLNADLAAVEERAEKRTLERITASKTDEEKAVQEATQYMESQLASIEADKTLNPTGEKIDAQELLKIVVENELIDTKGRWNYLAGFKLMKGTKPAPAPAPSTRPRKEVAAGTMGGSRGEAPAKDFATSDDFKGGNKPW